MHRIVVRILKVIAAALSKKAVEGAGPTLERVAQGVARGEVRHEGVKRATAAQASQLKRGERPCRNAREELGKFRRWRTVRTHHRSPWFPLRGASASSYTAIVRAASPPRTCRARARRGLLGARRSGGVSEARQSCSALAAALYIILC